MFEIISLRPYSRIANNLRKALDLDARKACEFRWPAYQHIDTEIGEALFHIG